MHVTCFNATKDHPITKILKLPISHNQVQKLCRELTAEAMIVSTSLGGGEHGHTFLIFSDTDYETFSLNSTDVSSVQDTSCPNNKPGIAEGDTSEVVNKKTAEWSGKRST